MLRKLSGIVAGVLAFAALIGISPASATLFYQPKAPKELTK